MIACRSFSACSWRRAPSMGVQWLGARQPPSLMRHATGLRTQWVAATRGAASAAAARHSTTDTPNRTPPRPSRRSQGSLDLGKISRGIVPTDNEAAAGFGAGGGGGGVQRVTSGRERARAGTHHRRRPNHEPPPGDERDEAHGRRRGCCRRTPLHDRHAQSHTATTLAPQSGQPRPRKNFARDCPHRQRGCRRLWRWRGRGRGATGHERARARTGGHSPPTAPES